RFSGFIKCVGDIAYNFLLFINRLNNRCRNLLGYKYWSLSTFIKTRVTNAAHAITIFEQAAINKARKEGYDGIVCGHIHLPNIINHHDIIYCNDGDWVENCTSLVERNDGKMELWHWSDRNHCMMQLDEKTIEKKLQPDSSLKKAS
ncbi:MAG: UDP-2,3-diacylglucosamine diphosphatase, partial [Pseudomonadales bacterium]|nr:UDP-2,3-diacylglucosamine diphosphatase [Pseudomonadales bacterium]